MRTQGMRRGNRPGSGEVPQANPHTTSPGSPGALLDLTARVLAVLPGVHRDQWPRMADFARSGRAGRQACSGRLVTWQAARTAPGEYC